MNIDIDILLTEELISILQARNLLRRAEASVGVSNLNAGVNRAVHWLVECNCAIISGWRQGNTREENDRNNQDLQTELRRLGYGVMKVRGHYAEVGGATDTENSFIVFDVKGEDPILFYETIRALSERFDQDCFLFKEAGREKQAYLVGTNEAFGRNRRIPQGTLRIGAREEGAFTSVRGGGFFFE